MRASWTGKLPVEMAPADGHAFDGTFKTGRKREAPPSTRPVFLEARAERHNAQSD